MGQGATDGPKNILVMIHGISPEPYPEDPQTTYGALWRSLLAAAPQLAERFPQGYIGVSWGRELPQTPPPTLVELRPDQCLTRAQNFINQKTRYEAVKGDRTPNNRLLQSWGQRGVDFPWFTPAVRGLVTRLREEMIIQGVGDAIYYGSQDGEFHIRRTVYGQILNQLDGYLGDPDVRLHIVGHSLGVTVSHDLLYGLFAPGHQPDYYRQAEAFDVQRFQRWRAKAEAGELRLGSLTSFASQLPLFVMRKQMLVDLLAAGQLLRAEALGIRSQVEALPGARSPVSRSPIQWQLFYDVDDLLAFATRPLYDSPQAIQEFQVDTGDNPATAHVSYWQNPTVIRETAQLLMDHSG